MKKIMGWLLHHANRNYSSKPFYEVKNRILVKHGVNVGYDVQHIEGKKCFTCGGTGIYHGYYSRDTCWNCFDGWYRRPEWNVLERVRLGKYVFHQPKERLYKDPKFQTIGTVDGYISHQSSYWGALAALTLSFIYNTPELRMQILRSFGLGWYLQWWRPRHWPNNMWHLAKHRRRSIPVQRFLEKLSKRLHPTRTTSFNDEFELPF